MSLVLTPVQNIPLIKRGNDLACLIVEGLRQTGINLADNDILVVAQKIVSKCEGRYRRLSAVRPTSAALKLAAITSRDARLIELMIRESRRILRANRQAIICENKVGLVCPNAGIDQKNVSSLNEAGDNLALLLPLNADRSAERIRRGINALTGRRTGVVIADSHGRPWRNGSVGMCIGLAGVPATVKLRGRKDLFGRVKCRGQIAVADELAAGASLMMGQNDEGYPVIHVRGFPYELQGGSMKELIRSPELEVFQ